MFLAQGADTSTLDRTVLGGILVGTAIVVLTTVTLAVWMFKADKRKEGRLLTELAFGLAVLGFVAALAVPRFLDQQAIGVIIGTLLGAGGTTLVTNRKQGEETGD